MTTRNRRIPRTSGKALVALLATTAAFAGGAQALTPAPAVAMIDQGGCPDPGLDFWGWQQCEYSSNTGGGGGGGATGATSGGTESTDNTWDRTGADEDVPLDFKTVNDPDNVQLRLDTCTSLLSEINGDRREERRFEQEADSQSDDARGHKGRALAMSTVRRMRRKIRIRTTQYEAFDCDTSLTPSD